jgi:hypothetical protein
MNKRIGQDRECPLRHVKESIPFALRFSEPLKNVVSSLISNEFGDRSTYIYSPDLIGTGKAGDMVSDED